MHIVCTFILLSSKILIPYDRSHIYGQEIEQVRRAGMKDGELGKVFEAGKNIVEEGTFGNCMYVIQEGKVEVLKKKNGREIRLAVLEEGEFFGEMAIVEKGKRSATVRALEDVRVLTIDKKVFLKRIHEDPSLAFHIIKTLSHRLRVLENQHSRVSASDRRNWNTRPEKFKGDWLKSDN